MKRAIRANAYMLINSREPFPTHPTLEPDSTYTLIYREVVPAHLILERVAESQEQLLVPLQLLPVQSPAGSGPQSQWLTIQHTLTHSLHIAKQGSLTVA